jgi:hypothetical protein
VKVFLVMTMALMVCSCAREEAASNKVLCSVEWLKQVEQKVLVGDQRGHGPDLGSGEWRSAVEFKLGIRGNPDIPPVTSDQWCSYIDKHFIN